MELVNQKSKRTKEKKATAPATELKMGGVMQKSSGVRTFFSKRRKFLVLSTMFVLLCVTGYLNFQMNANQTAIQTGGATNNITTANVNVLMTYRTAREDARARDIKLYTEIKNTTSDAEAKANAEKYLLEITTNIAFETNAEYYILTNAAIAANDVMVNRSGNFVNVILKRDTNIDNSQAAAIMTYLQTLQEGLDIDNVYISMM